MLANVECIVVHAFLLRGGALLVLSSRRSLYTTSWERERKHKNDIGLSLTQFAAITRMGFWGG